MEQPTQAEALRLADALESNFFDGKQNREVWDSAAAELRRLHAARPASADYPASQCVDSDSSHSRPIGFLPAYELRRIRAGHDAKLRSAKFGMSALDGDVPVYLSATVQQAEPVGDAYGSVDKYRLLKALERAAAAESELRALVDECDNDCVVGWEERMTMRIDSANLLLKGVPAADAKLPEWWSAFMQGVCEISDRNSPADEPNAIVATPDELAACATNAILAAIAPQ